MLAFVLKSSCSFHKYSGSLGIFTAIRIKFALHPRFPYVCLFVSDFHGLFFTSDTKALN